MDETTRRELTLLFPALLVAKVSEAAPTGSQVLPSKCFPYDSLAVKKNASGGSESRQVFTGETHEGFPIDMHITTLAPGQMPHAAHTHVHEEMIMLKEGTLDVTISQVTTRIGPGSVAYVDSNELHGWKNVGDMPSTYFVLAIGHQTKS